MRRRRRNNRITTDDNLPAGQTDVSVAPLANHRHNDNQCDTVGVIK